MARANGFGKSSTTSARLTSRKPRKPRAPPPGDAKEIVSLYASRCRRCGKWVCVLEKVLWSRGEGVWHLTEARCAEALESIEFKGRADPLIAGPAIARVGRLLEAAPWTFARTQPHQPHEWTLREQWADSAAFTAVVLLIKQVGVPTKWKRTYLRKLDVGAHYYWTMEPRAAPAEATQLINRGHLEPGGPREPPSGVP